MELFSKRKLCMFLLCFTIASAFGINAPIISSAYSLSSSETALSDPSENSCDISDYTVLFDRDTYEYTGQAIEPDIIVFDEENEIELIQDKDYTVEYENNINAGTAGLTVSGIGEYTGSIETTFKIDPLEIVPSILIGGRYQYTGNPVIPSITVKNDDSILIKDIDYDTEVFNNTNAGTATVKVTLKGNYSGSAESDFIIDSAYIRESVFQLEKSSVVYDGDPQYVKVSVKYHGNIQLVENKDYIVSYANNREIGTASVKITGIGNYTGDIT